MAFEKVKSLDGVSDPIIWDYRMTSGEACTRGQALNLNDGFLTNAGAAATTAPAYVAQASVAASTSATRAYVPVIRITQEQEFKTTTATSIPATLLGSTVTLTTGGLTVTATTTNGIFQLSATDASTSAAVVRGYFRR